VRREGERKEGKGRKGENLEGRKEWEQIKDNSVDSSKRGSAVRPVFRLAVVEGERVALGSLDGPP